ncbi:MAG: hypothetical protein IT374_06835 [Polyangiaceae bacterium]|nr:hypothetical protein [Polyangiaceae bacterium]
MSRDRSARRGADAHARVTAARERLFELGPGGAPARPIVLGSASLVEARATSLACPRCEEAALRVEEHAAETVDGVRLRAVRVRCARCGAARRVWFKLASLLAN